MKIVRRTLGNRGRTEPVRKKDGYKREPARTDRTGQGVDESQRARVRAGDQDEFGVLFTEHARAVYNHAFRLTGNWSAAEEVVSLTFLEAWRLRGTVRTEGGSLLPWMLGIALNVARNVSRRWPCSIVDSRTFHSSPSMSALFERFDEPT